MNKENQINVLFTSIGNCVSIIKYFDKARKALWMNCKLIAIDIDKYCPWIHVADKYYIVKRLDDLWFQKQILEICKNEEINLIIPTRDDDIPYFSEHIEAFKNLWIFCMVPSLEISKICNDKYEFYKYLVANNIPAIKTYEHYGKWILFPCIVKPRFGSWSKWIREITNEEEIKNIDLDWYVIQEKETWVEYTIDYFADFSWTPLCIIPRIRLKVFNWESVVWITKKNEKIISICKDLGSKMKLIWHNTIQCFFYEDWTVKILEINPRFWWWAPLGIEAWCNSPRMLLEIMQGKKILPITDFKENLVMIRYTDNVFIDENKI